MGEVAAVTRCPTVVWLLPAAFIVHDGEELVTMPGWIEAHRLLLDRIAGIGPLPRFAVTNLPTTTRQVAAAILAELLIFVAATYAMSRSPTRGPGLYLYSALLGAFAAHGLTHVGLAMAFRGYTPGVITAVVVIPPAGFVVYRGLFRANVLTPRVALVTAVAGIAALVPALLAAHLIGRVAGRT